MNVDVLKIVFGVLLTGGAGLILLATTAEGDTQASPPGAQATPTRSPQSPQPPPAVTPGSLVLANKQAELGNARLELSSAQFRLQNASGAVGRALRQAEDVQLRFNQAQQRVAAAGRHLRADQEAYYDARDLDAHVLPNMAAMGVDLPGQAQGAHQQVMQSMREQRRVAEDAEREMQRLRIEYRQASGDIQRAKRDVEVAEQAVSVATNNVAKIEREIQLLVMPINRGP